MTKNTVTRAQALEFAIAQCGDNAEVVEVLGKMLASITKPRAKAVSKARIANENLARKVADAITGTVTTKEVVGFGIPEIMTTQKAAAVLRVACELGLTERITDGKKVSYKRA